MEEEKRRKIQKRRRTKRKKEEQDLLNEKRIVAQLSECLEVTVARILILKAMQCYIHARVHIYEMMII